MKKFSIFALLILLPLLTQAQNPMHNLDLGAVQCNWGVLTMNALITLDFPMGEHSADPDGDGIGNQDPDKNDPRSGLPNLTGGDIEALCAFVGCTLFPEDPICIP